MQYYYTLFAITIIAGILVGSPKKKVVFGKFDPAYDTRKKVFLFIIFTFVFLLIGLRGDHVGADTWGYVNIYFQQVKANGIFNGSPEVLLYFLMWISQLFTQGHQLFFIIYAGLISFLYAKFIYDNSCDVWLSSIVFIGMFFTPSMNLMREWLAIGLGINALTAYRNNKNIKAIFLFILAFLSHITALCLVFLILFEKIKNKKRALYIIFAAGILFYIVRNPILNLVTSIVPRYYGYLNQNVFLGEGGFNIKDLIFIVIEIYYLVILISRKGESNDNDNIYEYIAFLFLAIVFSLCGQSYGIVHRLVYYYSVFLIISLPEMIEKSRFQVFIKIALIVGMFVMLYRNSYWDNNYVSNYMFFWQQ